MNNPTWRLLFKTMTASFSFSYKIMSEFQAWYIS
jgi:hypothetical protein